MLLHRHIVHASLAAQLLLAPGCGEPLEPAAGGFDDSANFSLGDGEWADVGSGELDRGECIADAKPTGGVYGYRHQCGGIFVAHLGLSRAGQSYKVFIPRPAVIRFGDGHEPYDEAKVMACCGAMDDALPVAEQPASYAENCLLDFRQQACVSLATSLAMLIDNDIVPAVLRRKAIEVQHYVAQHTDACIAALLADASEYPRVLQGARWDLPDDGPWSPEFDDVYVMIDIAVITAIDVPEQPQTCTDLGDNNDNVFTP